MTRAHTPYYDRDGITIYHGDSREILPALRYDAIVSDAPYGVGAANRLAQDVLGFTAEAS